MEYAFLGVFIMNKRNYKAKSLTIEVPSIINDGLNKASDKYNESKSDIVRSILYDFLLSSGVIEIMDIDSPDDKVIHGSVHLQSLLVKW